MKLTLKEVASLRKTQERIREINASLSDRAYHSRDTNDTETDAIIDELDSAVAGIERAIELCHLLINNIV